MTALWSAPIQSAVAGRPVVSLSLAINFAVGGLEPWGYHAWNLCVLVFSALLLAAILRRAFGLAVVPSAIREAGDRLAFACALVWLVHPLQTEVVEYVTQRTESMMGFFYLLTMYAAMRSMLDPAPGASRWRALSIAACAIGMATKEPMATAPLMVLLFDAVFVAGGLARALRERTWLYAGLSATWLVVIALNWSGPRSHSAGFSSGAAPWTYLLNQAPMLATYLKLVVWPHPLVLDYGFPRTLSLADVWLSGVGIVSLLCATAIAWRLKPQLAYLLTWFFVLLAPSSSLVPVATEVGAERRMHLPLAALVVIVAVALRLRVAKLRLKPPSNWPAGSNGESSLLGGRFAAGLRQLLKPTTCLIRMDIGFRRCLVEVASLVAVTGVLMALTIQRNSEYQSVSGIWQTVLDRRPGGRAHYNVGMELKESGRRDEAMRHFQAAVADLPDAHYAIAFELAADGRHEEAIDHYREFVRLKPDDFSVPRAYHQIGRALMTLDRLDEAAGAFREMLRMWPKNADGIGGLADVAMRQSRFDDAIAGYGEYVALVPGHAEAHFNLGLALAAHDREGEAVEQFARAVSLEPNDADMRETYGLALVSTRRLDEAVAQYRAALAIEPGRVSTRNALGAVLAAQGKRDEAAAEFRRSLELDPGNTDTRAVAAAALGPS